MNGKKAKLLRTIAKQMYQGWEGYIRGFKKRYQLVPRNQRHTIEPKYTVERPTDEEWDKAQAAEAQE